MRPASVDRVGESRGPADPRRPRSPLWPAAGAAALALLLLLLGGGREQLLEEAGSTRQLRVERRTEGAYELVSTSWARDEVAAPGGGPFPDSDELRLLNEARQRWQNLDVAIQDR